MVAPRWFQYGDCPSRALNAACDDAVSLARAEMVADEASDRPEPNHTLLSPDAL